MTTTCCWRCQDHERTQVQICARCYGQLVRVSQGEEELPMDIIKVLQAADDVCRVFEEGARWPPELKEFLRRKLVAALSSLAPGKEETT